MGDTPPPSLVDQHTSLGGTTVLLRQHPLRSWIAVWFVVQFLMLLFTPLIGKSLPLSKHLPAFLLWSNYAVVPLLLIVRSRARLSMTAAGLRVKAWVGKPALPRTHDIPLHALRLERHPDLNPDARCLITLWLERDGDAPIKIPNVTARGRDILALEAQLRDLRQAARLRHGAGTAEIPEDLRQMRERPTKSTSSTTAR